jgi:hypothetical protein
MDPTVINEDEILLPKEGLNGGFMIQLLIYPYFENSAQKFYPIKLFLLL